MLGVDPRWLQLPGVLPPAVVLTIVATASWDIDVARTVTHASPELISTGKLLSYFGLAGYMLVVAAIVAIPAALIYRTTVNRRLAIRARRWAQCAILFFVAIAVSGIVCQAIKHLVGRSRPKLMEQFGAFNFVGPTLRSSIDSFPSGHATIVFAAAVVLSLIRPRWTAVFLSVALLIGAARVVAGAHYPSDIVGGAALGSLVAFSLAKSFLARGLICDKCLKFPSIGGRRARYATAEKILP